MPSSSKAQHNFMAAIANSPAFAKKAGVPMSVGKDFTAADKALKLPTSTRNRADLQKVNNPKTNQGRNELFKEGGNTMATKMNPGMMAMMAKKKGAPAKKMAEGGRFIYPSDGRGLVKTPGDKKLNSPGSYATKILPSSMKPLTKDDQGSSYGGLGKKSGGMTKMATGGFVRQADGVAQQGTTKAKQIKMKSGGAAC